MGMNNLQLNSLQLTNFGTLNYCHSPHIRPTERTHDQDYTNTCCFVGLHTLKLIAVKTSEQSSDTYILHAYYFINPVVFVR